MSFVTSVPWTYTVSLNLWVTCDCSECLLARGAAGLQQGHLSDTWHLKLFLFRPLDIFVHVSLTLIHNFLLTRQCIQFCTAQHYVLFTRCKRLDILYVLIRRIWSTVKRHLANGTDKCSHLIGEVSYLILLILEKCVTLRCFAFLSESILDVFLSWRNKSCSLNTGSMWGITHKFIQSTRTFVHYPWLSFCLAVAFFFNPSIKKLGL